MAFDEQLPEQPELRRAMFLRLAKENEALMIRVARRLCGPGHDRAADCVQDALVQGFQAFMAGRLPNPGGFRPWILRVLTNKFLVGLRHYRRTQTDADVGSIVESRQVHWGLQDAERAILADELKEIVNAEFEALPVDQRLCVTLVDIEDLDYATTAAALEVPIGTVRSRLARARLKLADAVVRYEAGSQ